MECRYSFKEEKICRVETSLEIMCTSSTRPHRVRGQRYNGLEACKIEKEIESFVENFKKKGSVLDSPSLNRPPSLESCSSSQSRSSRLSSSIYSTDDFTDESPEKTAYLMPEIVRRYRYCSTTTSDSDYGDEDYRRLFLAYKDSKRHDEAKAEKAMPHLDLQCSKSDGGEKCSGKDRTVLCCGFGSLPYQFV